MSVSLKKAPKSTAPLSRAVLKLAAHYVRQGQRTELEYAEEVASYARQGYRAQHCIHGTNQWTDYDNICWGCEEGIMPSDRTVALARAKREVAESNQRLTDVAGFVMGNRWLSSKIIAELVDEAVQLIPAAAPNHKPLPLP